VLTYLLTPWSNILLEKLLVPVTCCSYTPSNLVKISGFSLLGKAKKYIPFTGTAWINVILSKLHEALQAYIDFLFSGLYLPAVPAGKLPMTSVDSYIPESTIMYKRATRR
jgi:hypothetical protein